MQQGGSLVRTTRRIMPCSSKSSTTSWVKTSEPKIYQDRSSGKYRLDLLFTPRGKSRDRPQRRTSKLLLTRDEAVRSSVAWRWSWEHGYKGKLVSEVWEAVNVMSNSNKENALPSGKFINLIATVRTNVVVGLHTNSANERCDQLRNDDFAVAPSIKNECPRTSDYHIPVCAMNHKLLLNFEPAVSSVFLMQGTT